MPDPSPAPSSRPDTTAREHADTVREALHRMLAEVERLERERDEARRDHDWLQLEYEAARQEVDDAQADARAVREQLRHDGHGYPSFHVSTCPGCALLADGGQENPAP